MNIKDKEIKDLTWSVETARRANRFSRVEILILKNENEKLQEALNIASISQEAMAEIKATLDGDSDQSLVDIVEGAISEIKRYPEGFTERFAGIKTNVGFEK